MSEVVCFCFQHTAQEIEADFRRHGVSTIVTAIQAACKSRINDCKTKNPRGTCCLGELRKRVKDVQATVSASTAGCCEMASADDSN